MKKSVTLVIAILISVASFAQIGFNYKAIIKDGDGNLVINQDIDLKFTVEYDGGVEFGIITQYVELHNTSTDSNGIVIVNIGEGTTISGTFPTTNWITQMYLILEVDLEQDGTFVNLGTSYFKKVPMAIRAEYAKKAATANNVIFERLISSVCNSGGSLQYDDFSFGSAQLNNDQNSTIDNSRMFFDKGKGAFRAGITTDNGGTASTAWDFSNRGEASFAAGNGTIASGTNSTAFGLITHAYSQSETVLGQFNLEYTPATTNGPGATNWNPTDRLFVIGNGANSAAKSNALTVLKNGKIGIGRDTPASILEVAHNNTPPTFGDRTDAFSIRNKSTNQSWQFHTSTYLNLYFNGAFRGSWNSTSGAYVQASDRRVKKDITAIENGTLDKVMQLNPVSYLMKDQTDSNRNLGLISQEVQELFPSLTHYVEESDLLTLSYTELIPILIKALQEQQMFIETQNSKLEAQQSENTTQNQAIQSLLKRMTALETSNNQ